MKVKKFIFLGIKMYTIDSHQYQKNQVCSGTNNYIIMCAHYYHTIIDENDSVIK
jgi:hypothetical protein